MSSPERSSTEGSSTERVSESLDTEVEHIIEEARMVLPGIQALFGFQLIAVYNNRFSTALSVVAQEIHLASLLLVALSIALIMAPAAYHRQAERNFVSRYFADYASHLVTVALIPLLIAISIDVGLVALIVTDSIAVAIAFAVFLTAFFAWFWFLLPRRRRRANKS